ncbi:MAG: hypothetical protein FJ100_11860, partial [Deltaproteobacteria bacterium]|nr:hypothetical protein [Deltaproteobacteria bacterium]
MKQAIVGRCAAYPIGRNPTERASGAIAWLATAMVCFAGCEAEAPGAATAAGADAEGSEDGALVQDDATATDTAGTDAAPVEAGAGDAAVGSDSTDAAVLQDVAPETAEDIADTTDGTDAASPTELVLPDLPVGDADPDGILPPPDTALPPPDTALPPPDTVLPPPDTALPPPDTALPPPDTALPPP